jgi:hypothetical protein
MSKIPGKAARDLICCRHARTDGARELEKQLAKLQEDRLCLYWFRNRKN